MRSTPALMLSFALAVPPVALAQQPAPSPSEQGPPETALRVSDLGGGVYALMGRGGNIGLFVGSDGAVLVDTQFADGVPALLDKVKSLTDKPIRYIINTHHHGDHVGGNAALRGIAPIIAHENVRKRMIETPREVPAPNLTYDSQLTLNLGGETIHLWHTPPAHTDGDTVVYFEKAHVLHMGDNLFFRVIPVIDVQAGGTPKGYLTMIDDVLARVPGDVKVIPGHGEITDVSGIKESRKYVSEIIDAARNAKAAGKTKEQFVAEVDLEAYRDYGSYARRFKSNCAAAYDELP